MNYREKYHDCFVECACHANEHLFRFSYIEGNEKDAPELYLHAQMYQHRSFFRRLWEGIKYVFRCRPHYGHWDETMIWSYDAKKLREYLDIFIEEEEAWYKEHAPKVRR